MYRQIPVDINCDMGEGTGNDALLMPFISSASIACGYHAGDAETLRTTLLLCKKYGVRAGAHPSFADRENFGRTEMKLSVAEIHTLITTQLQDMDKMAAQLETRIQYVKPHGALYNLSAKDKNTAAAIAQAVYDYNPQLVLMGLSGSVSITEAERLGLKTEQEVFADRTYQDDGSLTPRSQPHALITDVHEMLRHVTQLVNEQRVTSVSGKMIPIQADTVCIHGDGAHAVEFAQALAGFFMKDE